ncbi:MAG TPA: HAMP domain-containing sensor histidine kinase [Micromonosporaceae bacterium]|nr:HAMP domain-containing sensor histidine kinase [Micromonosporaceae bacterium]
MRRLLHRTPLRVKLIAAVLALVTAAMIVIGFATAIVLRRFMVADMDHDLMQVTENIKADVFNGKDPAPGSEYLIAVTHRGVWDVGQPPHGLSQSDIPALPAPTTLAPPLGQAEPKTVAAADGHPRWRMLVTTFPNAERQQLVVAKPMSDVDNAVGELIWADLLVGLGVLTVLGAIGVAMVRTTLRPLTEIERTAGAIAGGDLTKRVPEGDPRTEVGSLSQSLNAMLGQIEAAFTAQAASETAARAAESAARDAAVEAQVSEARARRSEERMRQFVADASHELRTPLTTIRGFAELYRQGAARDPEEVAKLLRRIEDEAARMGLLVEDLLLLARLDRERPLALAPVELPVIAADAVLAAQAIAPDRPVTLDIADGAGQLVVLGDDARLRQIVGNLMTNALTHTPEGSPVTVRLSRARDRAVLEVADKGPGLAAEQAERVFERFYRTDPSRTRRGDGVTSTGLGLAIVAALVAAHSGSVEVDSKPGVGATFRVRLPLAPDDDVHS